MEISESRTRELLQWLDDQAGDHTHLFEQMTLYRDAAALIRQIRDAEQAAWQAGLDAGREQGKGNEHCRAEPQPVAWQFQCRDGRWHGFIDEKHRQNTIADGSWPVRALYTTPPNVPVGVDGLLADLETIWHSVSDDRETNAAYERLKIALVQQPPAEAQAQGGGEVEYEFEVWQDDSLQAGGSTSDYATAKSEADHYALMYGQDGPVEVRMYVKRPITTPPNVPVEVEGLARRIESYHWDVADKSVAAQFAAELRGLAQQLTACGTCREAIRPDALTGTTCKCAHQPAAVNEAMRKVAAIAHSGGLIDMSPHDALTAIRRLSLSYWGKEEKPEQVHATLTAQQQGGTE